MEKTEHFEIIEILRQIFPFDISKNGINLEYKGHKISFTLKEYLNNEIFNQKIIQIPRREYNGEFRKQNYQSDKNIICLEDRGHMYYLLADTQLEKLIEILEIDENTFEYSSYKYNAYEVNVIKVVNYIKKLQVTSTWEEYIRWEENKRKIEESFKIIEILRKLFYFDISENGIDIERNGYKMGFTLNDYIERELFTRKIIKLPDKDSWRVIKEDNSDFAKLKLKLAKNREEYEILKIELSEPAKFGISLVDRESHLDRDLIRWYYTDSFSLNYSQFEELREILGIDENTPHYYEYDIPENCYKVNMRNVVNYIKKLQGTTIWEEYIPWEKNKSQREWAKNHRGRLGFA